MSSAATISRWRFVPLVRRAASSKRLTSCLGRSPNYSIRRPVVGFMFGEFVGDGGQGVFEGGDGVSGSFVGVGLIRVFVADCEGGFGFEAVEGACAFRPPLICCTCSASWESGEASRCAGMLERSFAAMARGVGSGKGVALRCRYAVLQIAAALRLSEKLLEVLGDLRL